MRMMLIFLVLNCLPSFAQEIDSKTELKVTDSVVIFINCDAEFPGGVLPMKEYFQNYEFPAWNDKESSKCGYVSFIVEADGSLMNIEVVRGISSELDDVMLRMIEEMPKWKPACDLNGPVRSRVRLPITFNLVEE